MLNRSVDSLSIERNGDLDAVFDFGFGNGVLVRNDDDANGFSGRG